MGRKDEWNRLKPQRPKRPATGFSHFVAEYSKRPRPSPGQAAIGNAPLMRQAAEAWNAFDDAARQEYANDHAMAEYRQNFEEYKEIMAAMKGPPGAYALFVRQFWVTNRPVLPKGRASRQAAFGNMARQIAEEWEETSEADKDVYRAQADLAKALFERERDKVLNGQGMPDFNMNWLAEGLREAITGLIPGPRQAPAAASQDPPARARRSGRK